MLAYIAGSPFVLQNIYEVTPQQFSLLFALNELGIILLFIVVWQELSLLFLTSALFLVVSSLGMVSTAAFSLGMQSQGDAAGSASAFLRLLPFLGGGLVSPLVGLAGDMSAWPMGIVILICSSGALLFYFLFVRKNTGVL